MREWGCMSICRDDQLLGLPLTHNSQHVAGTFKRLINTTTHCGLIKFINTDGFSYEACNQIRPWSL